MIQKAINYIRSLKNKPQHVRERILLVTMAVIAPVIFTVWYATFQLDPGSGAALVNNIQASAIGSMNNTDLNNTFGTPALTPATDQDSTTQPVYSEGSDGNSQDSSDDSVNGSSVGQPSSDDSSGMQSGDSDSGDSGTDQNQTQPVQSLQ